MEQRLVVMVQVSLYVQYEEKNGGCGGMQGAVGNGDAGFCEESMRVMLVLRM